MRGRTWVVLVVTAVSFAACSSDGDDAVDVGGSTRATEAQPTLADTEPDDTMSREVATTDTPATAASAPTDVPSADTIGLDPIGADPLPPLPDDVALPIVFVHGFAGSAQQYESQKMRFVANGYPSERIVAYEHDGAGMDFPSYAAGTVAAIDAAIAEFGVDQVYLVGHSRGTFVSDAVLADPVEAAKVAKYIAIDGRPCPAVGDVPCIAPNQEALPGQAHVETATSKESFAMQYEFLVGEAPDVVDIESQIAPVVLSGRAVNFPANTGREGVTLDIWAIDADTGARSGDAPIWSSVLPADGSFGPVEVGAGQHYEYVLSAPDSPTQHHLYLQPYVRSSDFVRLLSSPADGPTRTNTNTGDGHSSVIAMRMREWYAVDDPDVAGDQVDVLQISTDGGEVVNAIPPFVGDGAIGIHVHDDAATPGVSTLEPLPYFSEQPFQSGVDVHMPASPDGSGTITITNIPRGDTSRAQTLNVPNWPSGTHATTVVFADHPVG